jgi:hypothetical protein
VPVCDCCLQIKPCLRTTHIIKSAHEAVAP